MRLNSRLAAMILAFTFFGLFMGLSIGWLIWGGAMSGNVTIEEAKMLYVVEFSGNGGATWHPSIQQPFKTERGAKQSVSNLKRDFPLTDYRYVAYEKVLKPLPSRCVLEDRIIGLFLYGEKTDKADGRTMEEWYRDGLREIIPPGLEARAG